MNENISSNDDIINLTIPENKIKEYQKRADSEGKSLNQFIIDKIEGVPYDYTMKNGKIVVHEPQAEKIKKAFKTITSEPIISKETFLNVEKILSETLETKKSD